LCIKMKKKQRMLVAFLLLKKCRHRQQQQNRRRHRFWIKDIFVQRQNKGEFSVCVVIDSMDARGWHFSSPGQHALHNDVLCVMVDVVVRVVPLLVLMFASLGSLTHWHQYT